MKEQLITFETAKLAKEKGFEEGSMSHYEEYGQIQHCRTYFTNGFMEDEEVLFEAPTQSLLQKWLREVHSVEINIIRLKNSYMFFIFKNYKDPISKKGFKNYEEVLEEALKYGLKLIK